MPTYPGPSVARPGDVVGTLRLLGYLGLALVLIVLDQRGGWLTQARTQANALVQPLWAVAGLPGRLMERLNEDAGTLAQLTERNRELRRQLLLNQARMARLQALAADNARLRGLLDAAERGNLDVLLVPILDVDLDPSRQRLVLDAGSRVGLRVGQSVIDAGGLLGQITGTTPMHAEVLLVTDPDHAVPVVVVRTGVRLVAYGTGRSDRLALRHVPMSSDLKVGDVLVTSGLGNRFPPGFPVGTVVALRPDESRAFLVGDVRPAAQLDRGRDVLVQLSVPDAPPVRALTFDPALPPVATPPATAAVPASPVAPAQAGAPAGASPAAPAGARAARPQTRPASTTPSPPSATPPAP